jgi:hypothetical protein
MAAASNGRKTTPARARRSTTQTIAQIEARAAEVREAERDALFDLAEFLRALAVELPVESKLPLKFAESAKALELFGRPGGTLMVAGYGCAMDDLVHESAEDAELAAAVATIRALEMFPAASKGERSLRELVPHLREAYGLGEEA